jgi:hypothetical protein
VVVGGTSQQREQVKAQTTAVIGTQRGAELVSIFEQSNPNSWFAIQVGHWEIGPWANLNTDVNHIDVYVPETYETIDHTIKTASQERIIGHEKGHAITGQVDPTRKNPFPQDSVNNIRNNENPIAVALGQPGRR